MEWTDNEVVLLRKLARTSMSYSEMGEELHRSKGSVARKARDLGLPARPMPASGIQPDRGRRADNGRFEPRKEEVRRAGKVTLPPLASLRD